MFIFAKENVGLIIEVIWDIILIDLHYRITMQ